MGLQEDRQARMNTAHRPGCAHHWRRLDRECPRCLAREAARRQRWTVAALVVGTVLLLVAWSALEAWG